MFERYTSHPLHLITYVLPILLLGAATFAWGWEAFGTICFILGGLCGLVIVVTLIWQAHAEYVERLAEAAKQLHEVRDPEVWEALGYARSPLDPAPQATVTQPIASPPDVPKLAPGSKQYAQPPVNGGKMRLFANAVLRGAPLSEHYWTSNGAFTGPEIRHLKEWMEHPERMYIRLVNAEHPKQGYMVTPKGTRFLLNYGDEEIKNLYATDRVGDDNPILPIPNRTIARRAGETPTLSEGDVRPSVE